MTLQTQQVQQMQVQPLHTPPPYSSVTITCSLRGSITPTKEARLVGAHFKQQQQENVNYLGNSYHLSWWDHPNLSLGGKQQPECL